MKRVALFKSESEEYQRAFRERGYEPVFVEPLRFEWRRSAELAGALGAAHDALVLTSPRAVEAVARAWSPARHRAWAQRRLYVVGAASERQAAALLGLPARGAAAGSADQLARLIVEENPEGTRFLFPCGNLRSETLPEALEAKGMILEALTVYETKENEELRSLLLELNASPVVCCIFFSPSGCEYVYRQLQTFANELGALPHFAIGNATAHRMQQLGAQAAAVAPAPRVDALLDCVHRHLTAAPPPEPASNS